MTKENMQYIINWYSFLRDSLDKVLIGHKKEKDVIALSLLCNANSKILLMGTTGAGKTILADFLANSFVSEKISMIADIFPEDIQNQLKDKKNMQMLVINELNRTKANTLNTLLDLFSEKEINIGGKIYPFEDFHVVATQNLEEIAGLFTVPLAVYDRFDVSIYFDELEENERREVLFGGFEPITKMENFFKEKVYINQLIQDFSLDKQSEDILMQISKIIRQTLFNEKKVFFGTNIRGDLFLIQFAKLISIINGHDKLLPSDISSYIRYIYGHRANPFVLQIGSTQMQEYFDEIECEILKKRRLKHD